MDSEWNPYLYKVPAANPLMWIADLETDAIIDMTPATARFMESHDPATLPRTLSRAEHWQVAQNVVDTGESAVLVEWVKYDGAWHKIMRTKSQVGESCVLDVAQDITSLDPRADWLARINLGSQRLELDNGQSFSFDEFVVLHFLLKGLQYKQIAGLLDISPKTVEYRLSRLKDALDADTVPDLLHIVTSSGLVLLAMVPVDPANPAMTEVELYRKIPG